MNRTNNNQFSMTKAAMFNTRERWKQEQLTGPVNGSDRYLTPPFLQLLCYRKCRPIKTFPADQETIAAENTA